MVWLLIGLIVLMIIVNIRSFVILAQFQKEKATMAEDNEHMKRSMEEFVANLEKENDELYSKMVNYIKLNEQKLEQRLRQMEELRELPASPEQSEIIVQEKVEAGSEQEKIGVLHKQGFTPKQISKIVQEDFGKVELVINMLNKKKGYNK
jgi:DNA primase large subunit